MALEQNVRQIGDVAILDLSGRLSLGEALAFVAKSLIYCKSPN